MNWSIEKQSEVTSAIRIQYSKSSAWEQWGLIFSDVHLDNPMCRRELHKKHLEQAKERNAFCLSFGDLFDAMQGKQDKRSSKSDLDAKLKKGTYLNELVKFASDFYKPYISNLALLGEGNHESSITNKYEYSILDGLVSNMNMQGGNIIRGGYRGWVRFLFETSAKGNRRSLNAYYVHGSGAGGAAVTKGVIDTSRRAVYLPDADMVFSGHSHESWIFPLERVRLLNSGREVLSRQYHVQLPTYKDEFSNNPGGWHIETGKPPKPIGAYWMRFYYSAQDDAIKVQFTEAEN